MVADLNRCQGHAQCVFLAPDVFAPNGDDSRRGQVARAVAACPVQPILLDELDERDEAGEAYGVFPVGSDVR